MDTTGASKQKLILSVIVTILVTAAAIFALHKVLEHVSWDDIAKSLGATSSWRIIGAMLLTTFCYLALSGYDQIALRSLGRTLPWRRVVLGSSSAYALSHNLGFAPITASYARHKVYLFDGVGLADVARIVVLTGASFWLGVILVMGFCLIAVPNIATIGGMSLSQPMQIALGLVVIDVFILYLLCISRGWKSIGWGNWKVPLPNFNDAVTQAVISLLEMSLASAVLWILMPHASLADYPIVLVAYVTAFVAVLITHAPGGAGVLEAVVILMLPHLPKAEVLSALIMFRLVFHLMPLGVAIGILTAHSRPRVG